MASVDDDTRRFRRRLSDRPAHVWTRRAFWFGLGVGATLAYVAVMRAVLGPI